MKRTLLPLTAIIGLGAVIAVLALVLFPGASGPRGDAPTDTGSPAATLSALREAFEDRAGPPLSGSWQLSLPEDHASHPEANAETWGLIAHLVREDGPPVSAILTLSRFSVAPEPAETGNAWTPRAAWLGQAALTTPDGRAEERLSRGVGAAGADAASGTVWLDDWVLQHPTAAGDGSLTLRARVEGHLLDLTLAPVKPPVAPGEATDGPARGFALPRLEVSGRIGPGETELRGVAWLDRLWGDLPAPGGPLVYDRMIVHLDDGTDLSLLRTRRRDGRGGATLDGILVDAGGAGTALAAEATWTEGDVPGVWTVRAPGLALRATELPGGGLRDFAAPVRHAALRVEGTRAGEPVSGTGTLLLSPELTP